MSIIPMDRVRVHIPVVTVHQPPAPTFSKNRPLAPQRSITEVQCIAQNEVTDEWPDGHLNAWIERGWAGTRMIRRGPHAFFYLQRRRISDSERAG